MYYKKEKIQEPPSSRIQEWHVLMLVLLIGVVVRTVGLGRIPPGLNQDEASAGYDAFALLYHGIDRNGYRYPVHLVAWGSGQNALYSYLTMPFIVLFDLNAFSVRCVNCLFGIVTLPVFYALVKRIADRTTALLAVFLLAINPWHVMLSRWALESNLFPGIFVIGVWLLVRALEQPRLLVVSFACFAVSLYAYGSSYLVVPLFLTGASAYLLWRRKLRLRPLLAAGAVFVIVGLPIGLFVLVNIFKMDPIRIPILSIPRLIGAARFTMVTSLFGDAGGSSFVHNFGRFLDLMVTQNDRAIFNQVPGYGYAYWFGPALALLGIVVTVAQSVRSESSPGRALVLLWFAIGVLLGFVYRDPNFNQLNTIFLPLIFFAAAGIAGTARWLASRWRRADRVVLAAAVLMHLVAFGRFSKTYFTEFPGMISEAFFDGFGDAIAAAAAGTSGPICFTGSVNMPYIFVLFYTQADPNRFLETVRYANPGQAFQLVVSFDRYSFGLENCSAGKTATFVLHRGEVQGSFRPGDRVREFKNYVVVEPRP
jgi:4-amino-4-deoxy-L-arabinose transferase-like glycosyltransferase